MIELTKGDFVFSFASRNPSSNPIGIFKKNCYQYFQFRLKSFNINKKWRHPQVRHVETYLVVTIVTQGLSLHVMKAFSEKLLSRQNLEDYQHLHHHMLADSLDHRCVCGGWGRRDTFEPPKNLFQIVTSTFTFTLTLSNENNLKYRKRFLVALKKNKKSNRKTQFGQLIHAPPYLITNQKLFKTLPRFSTILKSQMQLSFLTIQRNTSLLKVENNFS